MEMCSGCGQYREDVGSDGLCFSCAMERDLEALEERAFWDYIEDNDLADDDDDQA